MAINTNWAFPRDWDTLGSLLMGTAGSDSDDAQSPERAASAVDSGSLADPTAWVDHYGDYLYGFALSRTRDQQQAEDLVQETFLAALRDPAKFAGRSAPRSWLLGILKNKIIDHYRQSSRETSFSDLEFYKDQEQERFQPEGVYKDAWILSRGPQEWPIDPTEKIENDEFWSTFRDCSSRLPKKVARVFILREVEDLPAKEVCHIMNITPANLWVMLHRARMALRTCLETNWFSRQPHDESGH